MARWVLIRAALGFGVAQAAAAAPAPAVLADTRPLTAPGDLSREMIAGIDRFALREIDQALEARSTRWRRDLTSPEAYARSVRQNRDRFRQMIGAVDERVPMTGLERVGTTTQPPEVAEADDYTVHAVRWPVFARVHGEGLLLQPKGPVRARVVALPDADQTPEQLAGVQTRGTNVPTFARRLAENGVQVLVPVLLDRRDEGSGNGRLKRFTNQPHREWIYRQAFQMGRHIIGYEVQKVFAAVDWFAAENDRGPRVPVGVAGYAEGGLIALYAAALDPRIDTTLVSGYFDSREKVWAEPIYRNVFGLLEEFGDAEIASLIVPRALVVEHAPGPGIGGPPDARAGRLNVAAPGVIDTPALESVTREFNRVRAFCGPALSRRLQLCTQPEEALLAFWQKLRPDGEPLAPPGKPPATTRRDFFTDARQLRQVRELEEHTQELVRVSEDMRQEAFWQKLRPDLADNWSAATSGFRTKLWTDVIGRLPPADVPLNPRTRKFTEQRTWTGYEVVLDVWRDVYAWGYLLLPKDLKPGQRRPVVVCQHGLEGLPADMVNEDPASRAFGYYHAFAARLAERGFIVFAPHNPYRGRDEFRALQRKLNPLRKTLYSVIAAQHDRILAWLSSQPFVESSHIGFYGFSYGGKTAMRLPALFDRYAVTICSGDFTDWVRKTASVDLRNSYLYAPEYEMFEFNQGNTFNYAELAALIAPRPFMVERGHHDPVTTDEWVAYEFAKVARLYAQLGIRDRAAIEYFDGPHRINGVGTFEFLQKHLNWPRR